jgi:hypothetical protein
MLLQGALNNSPDGKETRLPSAGQISGYYNPILVRHHQQSRLQISKSVVVAVSNPLELHGTYAPKGIYRVRK